MLQTCSVRGIRIFKQFYYFCTTIRFSQSEYSAIALLAFSLDCTVSRATAILLDISMSQIRFVNAYIKEFLQHELSKSQMREFKEILRYVNKNG